MTSLDPVAFVRGTPPVRRPPRARLRGRREGARDRVLPRADAAPREGRRAGPAPLHHPQGRGAARAGRPDAAGARGGRGVRLHLPHLRHGDARRLRRGGPPRVPAAEEAVRGAPRPRSVLRPLRLRPRRAAPQLARAVARRELPAGPGGAGVHAPARTGGAGAGDRHRRGGRAAHGRPRASRRCSSTRSRRGS